MAATSEAAFTEHCARLDTWLQRDDPRTTRGINLKHAVLRLCVIMRLAPDWSLGKDDDWVAPSSAAATPACRRRPAPWSEARLILTRKAGVGDPIGVVGAAATTCAVQPG